MNRKLLSVTAVCLAVSLLAACTGTADPVGTDVPSGTTVATPADTTVGDTAVTDTETADAGTTAPDGEIIPEPEKPALPADAITVTEAWGIRTGVGNALQNSLILTEKLAALPDGATVYFPEGTYEVAFPMFLMGKNNLRLVGYKATLLRTGTVNTTAAQPPVDTDALPAEHLPLTSLTAFIYAEQAAGLTVEGLTFDYDTPTSLSGRVLSVSGGTAEIEITDGSTVTGGEYATVINTFTEDGTPDRVLEQYAESSFTVEKTGERTVKVSGLSPGGASNLKKGTRVCLRLCTGRDYVIHVQGGTGLLFKDLTLRASYNGGIILTERCGDATLQNVRVQSENREALMSLNADALHIADMTGKLIVEGCTFDRPGDDCINVHSGAYAVESVSGTTVSMASPRFGSSAAWGMAGDTLAFYDPATFTLLGTAQITAVDGKAYTLTALPDGIQAGTVVANQALKPAVEIRSTTVRNTRARGFLLQTDKVTVESCSFLGTALAAILVAPDIANWYEMSPANDLTVRNNTFENCGHHAAGVIQITASHDAPDKTYPAYMHEQIKIEDNRFTSLRTPAVYALCIKGLTLTGNKIDTSGYSGAHARLIHCHTVVVDEAISGWLESTDVTDVSVAK